MSQPPNPPEPDVPPQPAQQPTQQSTPPPPPGYAPPPVGYGYAPPPGFPPPAYLPPAKAKSNGMALTSMILGILGITVGLCLLFFPVMPILAVVFGHISLSQMRKSGAPGRGFAIAGLVTGYIGIALAVLWLIGLVVGTFTSPMPTF